MLKGSIRIPLEQGLRPLGRNGVFRHHYSSIRIPLEQGLRHVPSTNGLVLVLVLSAFH